MLDFATFDLRIVFPKIINECVQVGKSTIVNHCQLHSSKNDKPLDIEQGFWDPRSMK